MKPLTLEAVRGRLARHRPARAEPGRIETAVAIVLAALHEGGLEALFIRRAERAEDPWSGQMGLPGGRRESDDPDLLSTAVRETLEETGIDLSSEPLLGELDDLVPGSPQLPPIAVRPFVFGLPDRPAVRPSAEVAQYLWMGLERLPAARTQSEVVVRGVRRTQPSYRLGPHVVWGITYRIINQLLELVL